MKDKEQTMKTKPVKRELAKANPLQRALAGSEALTRVQHELFSGEGAPLAYPTLASACDRKAMIENVSRPLCLMADSGELIALSLQHHRDPALESSGQAGELDFKKLMKVAGAIKKSAPDSISVVGVAPAASNNPAIPWYYCVVISTLSLTLANEGPNRPRHRSAPRAGTADLGPRPEWAEQKALSLSHDEIKKLVSSAFTSSERLRAECRKLAREAGLAGYATSAVSRAFGAFAMAALLPLKRSVFASGKGKVIVDGAMIEPTARAKAAKKVEGRDLDRLHHLLWQHAHAEGRDGPPFIAG